MAQDLSSLFSKGKRKTPDLDLTPEASQVVARDFNLFYKPEEEPVDPTVGIFLKSLDDFVNQAGTKMVMAGEKKLKDVGEAEAKKQRVESQKSFKKAVEAGEIDKNANPYLIDKYKQKKDPQLLVFISSLIELFYNELSLKNNKKLNIYFYNKFKILRQINDVKKFNLDKNNLFISLQGILKNES